MSVRALLAAAAAASPSEPTAGDALVVLTAPIASAASGPSLVAAAGRAALAGARMSWEPGDFERQSSAAWCAAGWGEAARIDAAGPQRFSDLRRAGDALLGSVIERRAPGCEAAPAPRLYGGLRFTPAEAAAATESGPWSAFPDASFVLPRWLCTGDAQRGYLQLAARQSELRNPAKLLAELAQLEQALGPAAATENIEFNPKRGELAELSPHLWQQLIEDALRRIDTGELLKVVAARQSHLRAAGSFDVAAVLAALRSQYPECTRFAFQRGAAVFLGATPEKLVERRDRQVLADALAGSCPRAAAADAQTDDATAAALLADDKERREHQHVVAAIRSTLAGRCDSVQAAPEPGVRRLRNVLHLWTPVQAELRQDAHVLELLAVLHPTPAVCGVPRDAAARWIATREPAPRGWYAAPVGWFDGRGDGVFCVGIRSAVVELEQAWLFAGAGIVAGSDPAKEYRETAAKQRAMLAALGGAA